jgi:hypothetical protein
MVLDSANARELTAIAHEIGAGVLEGTLIYPSGPAAGSWAPWT